MLKGKRVAGSSFGNQFTAAFPSLLDGMLMTPYTLNMMVHAVMYSYYFASIFIKDLDKVADVKKSITIMQMVSARSKAFVFRWH